MKHILILCTGNSCRSIMAEALINHMGNKRYHAVSVGSKPTGLVHPKAISTLKEYGINPGTPTSKSWDAFTDQSFDIIITVCDQAADEQCPIAVNSAEKWHWSTPDPAQAKGTENEINRAFDQAFQMLKHRIQCELL